MRLVYFLDIRRRMYAALLKTRQRTASVLVVGRFTAMRIKHSYCLINIKNVHSFAVRCLRRDVLWTNWQYYIKEPRKFCMLCIYEEICFDTSVISGVRAFHKWKFFKTCFESLYFGMIFQTKNITVFSDFLTNVFEQFPKIFTAI